MSKLIIPFSFERQNKEPLEVDYKVKTLAELNDLEVKPTTYEGQQAYCVETSTLYIYNKDGEFEPLSNKQDTTSDDLKTTDKTIVGAINEVKDSIITNYEDLTNKPSIAGVELDGNKSLSDLGITMYDDTEVKGDIGNLNTYKQNKTDDTLETTDKTIVGAINEVNGNSLGTVGFSADYKNIILNRKNGLNPYIIPISAIIHNAKLTELNDIDSTDIGNGKTLVYDSATQKHKYVDSTGTDELVKMETSTEAHYLSDLIDKSTIVNDNGTLKVKKLDGQEVTITEINYLKGLTMNVMDLVNMFSNGGVKIINTPVATYADLLVYDKSALIEGISYLIYVLVDETHDNVKTTYLIDKNTTTPTYFGFAGEHRDFTTNPIDLANEVTGKLGASNIDVDALWKLLTINDTYKTLTTNNEVFGTHGAKALYDELVASIGDKANASDIPTKVSELENDSNFVGLNDTQASDTTTYSSNKIADLITKATAGKDLGDLLIVENSADMFILATKDNLGKSALYIGDDTYNYTKGEIYELYWDAITINYLSFAYSSPIKFNFKKIQEILGDRTSLTVTGEYGYQNQADWRITTNIGMGGGSLGNYGIIPIQDKFAFGDKFKYTYNNSKGNSYSWLPTGNRPTWNLTKAWYNIDRFIMYNGADGIYKKGRVYRLTGDKVKVSTNSSEISNLTIDKNKFLNNCSLRGNIFFKWMGSEGYFALDYDGRGDTNRYTKKQFNSWGITYDGDITIGNKYIEVVTSKELSISNWEWKDVTDIDAINTKLDKKIDKTSIITAKDNSATDAQVYSAKVINTELDKINNNLGEKADVNKVAKKIYIKDVSSEDARTLIQNHWNEFDRFEFYNLHIDTAKWAWNAEIYAHTQEYGTVLLMSYGSDVPRVFYGKLYNNVWTWKELATVDNVKDVGVTTITPVNSAITGTIEYTVKNDICYVSLFNVKSTTNSNDLSISTTMPKSAINCGASIYKGSSGNIGFVYIDKNTTQLKANFYTASILGSCSFSYPVAES